jgi:hypothetical protein
MDQKSEEYHRIQVGNKVKAADHDTHNHYCKAMFTDSLL